MRVCVLDRRVKSRPCGANVVAVVTSYFAVCGAVCTQTIMSRQATLNVVDDEEMSSQGSVNAPVARPTSPVVQGPTYQTPSGLPPWPVLPMEQGLTAAAPMQQSIFVGPRGGSAATTTPVQSTEVLAAPTVPVDSPTRAETQKAFEEVSSAL